MIEELRTKNRTLTVLLSVTLTVFFLVNVVASFILAFHPSAIGISMVAVDMVIVFIMAALVCRLDLSIYEEEDEEETEHDY